jgi:hypothetical protein
MALSINFFSLNLRDPAIYAKFGGVYESFFRALRDHSCNVVYRDEVSYTQADILVVPMGGGQEYISLQAMRRFPGPVILYVPPAHAWFDQRLLCSLRGKVLFAYGMDASRFSPRRYREVGIEYHYLPFASDPEVMKPLNIPRQYDVVFAGSLGHAPRRSEFLEPLMEAIGSKSILCVGSGWQKYGMPEQLVAWGPVLNVIYNLGKVCINIHTSSQVQGPDKQIDLNNRVFDLAMAGCCQVCDNPEAVRQCFGKDEIAFAQEPNEWVERVLFLLDHPAEAESLRHKGLRRAQSDHTWSKRASEFLKIIEPRHANWKPEGVENVRPHLGMVLAEGKRRLKSKFRAG